MATDFTQTLLLPLPDDVAYVRGHFNAVCQAYGLSPDTPLAKTEWAAVEQAYGEPHRAYHTLKHIAHMLRAFEKAELPAGVLNELRAFALYHDFCYETANLAAYRQNEFLSAARGVSFLLRLKTPEGMIDRFKVRVLATQTHDIDVKADPYGAFALDVDMSILAVRPELYRAYVRAIRLEFAAIPEGTFIAARRDKFLRPTLEKKRIFITDAMHKKLNARALQNLTRELLAWGPAISPAPRP